MAEMAIADGITHVIATPHAHSDHVFDPVKIKERRDELQAIFEGRLILATGCDFHLSYENLEDIRFDPYRYTLNQKNYLLVEFADFSIPPSLDQALHNLQLAGLSPDCHASGTEPADSRAARAAFQLAGAGLLRAGDRAIAARQIRKVGAGVFAALACGWRGAFHRERRAQRDVAATAFEGDI